MRMWEIRENSRKKSFDYECGYEDGYEAAMKELKEELPASYRMGPRWRDYETR